jgi:hypothetical protein
MGEEVRPDAVREKRPPTFHRDPLSRPRFQDYLRRDNGKNPA